MPYQKCWRPLAAISHIAPNVENAETLQTHAIT
jgi:hypothetical protein